MDIEVKRHKNIARFIVFLGVLPGVWFLLARNTELGTKLQIQCGYWIIALVILTAIWVMYAVLTKILMRDIRVAHDHAGSLTERRHYKMVSTSAIIEALFASLIFGLSLIGFLVTDIQCYLGRL